MQELKIRQFIFQNGPLMTQGVKETLDFDTIVGFENNGLERSVLAACSICFLKTI